MIHGYSSIYNLGHKLAENLFKNEVLIEEKVDGSQFSFGKYDGVLHMKSKGAILYPPVANNLFKAATEYVISIQDKLVGGYTYRGEVLHRPKHNALTYGRVPKHNIVIFDIDAGEQKYLDYENKYAEAQAIDLEVVPIFYEGLVENVEQMKEFFEKESFLGGVKIEGFVIKNYEQFGADKKVLMGKWVSEAFKEVHGAEWKKSNPNKHDVIQNLVTMYKTEARWNKAIQHLQEKGLLQDAPQDIGLLMKEVSSDVFKEEADTIKEKLFEMAWPQISRGITGGLPEFYKNKLAEKQTYATKES